MVEGVPGSPRAGRLATPGWFDGRVLIGVLLVLVSVVVGARVLAGADRSTEVWTTTRALASGTQLGEDDLERARVRLFGGTAGYLGGDKPVGYVLRRSLGAGELVPESALATPGRDVDYRSVTVPVPAGHLAPDLASGQQVDVWVTPDDDAPGDRAPRLVLQAVTVLQRAGEGSAEGDEAVVLQVPLRSVVAVLAAVDLGVVDLVRVPAASEADVELTPAG